jgi:protein-disulfide isomerase
MHLREHNPHKDASERAARLRRRAFCAGLFAAAAALAACERGEPSSREVAGVAEVNALFAGIPQHGPELGDPAAPATLTVFSDLQCPHCRDFELHVLPVLIERDVRPGRLRIVYRNLPILGDASDRAARVAVAAGQQDRMWQFVDLFFHNQGAEGSGYVTDAFLRRLATAVPGLDVERALAERDAPAVEAEIAASRDLARARRVAGVPTMLLGRSGEEPRDLPFRRASDPDAFVGPIEDLLDHKAQD